MYRMKLLGVCSSKGWKTSPFHAQIHDKNHIKIVFWRLERKRFVVKDKKVILLWEKFVAIFKFAEPENLKCYFTSNFGHGSSLESYKVLISMSKIVAYYCLVDCCYKNCFFLFSFFRLLFGGSSMTIKQKLGDKSFDVILQRLRTYFIQKVITYHATKLKYLGPLKLRYF